MLSRPDLVRVVREAGPASVGLEAHLQMINSANKQHTVINVFGISATDVFRTFCMTVASDNGGTYTDVQ